MYSWLSVSYFKRIIIMTTVQKSIRLPKEAVQEIEALASDTGKDFSGIARDLLIEAVKMRRCPGVTFADDPTAKHALMLPETRAVRKVLPTSSSEL
jgi:ribosome-binding factor A